MNAKGTRFLAVLAVMAMAFAAFAVVDLSDATSSYANRTITFDAGEVTVNPGSELSGPGAYYFEKNATVSVTGTAPVVIFLVDGVELTISSSTATVGVYSVQKMNTTSTSSSSSELKLVVKNGLKASCMNAAENDFVKPTTTEDITEIGDIDLPAGADKYVVKNGVATIETDNAISVAAGWTLKANVVFKGTSGQITLNEGSVYNGTASYTTGSGDNEETSSAKLVLKAASSTNTFIKAGSIEISGSYTGEGLKAAIDNAQGDVKLVDVTVTSGSVAINTPVEITKLTVNNGATVAINETPEFTAVALGGSNLTVNGTLNQGTGVDLTAAVIDADSQGTIDNVSESTDMEQLIVKGNSSDGDVTFPAYQQVIVENSWTLVPGANVTIKGELVVPEGTKIIISHKATLNIDNNAKVEIYGDVIVEAIEDADDANDRDGKLLVTTGSVEVMGTLTIQGTLELTGENEAIYGQVDIVDGGVIYITADGTLKGFQKSQLNVGPGSILDVEGTIEITTIYNYGTTIIDTFAPATGNSKIYQMADGANINVANFTAEKINDDTPMYSLTITDEKMVVYSRNGTDYTVMQVVNGAKNEIVIQPADTVAGYASTVSGLFVEADLTSTTGVANTTGYLAVSQKNYTNKFEIVGSIAIASFNNTEEEIAAASTANVTVTVNGGRGVVVPEIFGLEIGDKVTFANTGILDAKGEIDASLYSQNGRAIFTNTGTFTVIGDGSALVSKDKLGDIVNACEYKAGTTAYPWYVYLSMDSALDIVNTGLVTSVDVRGTNSVTKDNVIPEGVTFNMKSTNANPAVVNVGSAGNTDILLYIEEGGFIKGAGTVNVDASMYAETSASVKNVAVISDVKSQQMDGNKVVKNGWVLWTNLAKALNTATAGDTVTISREGEFVYINTSTEIKEGVTLKSPADFASLYLKNGVTLTVNGTLDVETDVYAETKFAVTASNIEGNRSSAVVVNGIYKTVKDTPYADLAVGATPAIMSAGAPIAGAYYSIDGDNYVSNLYVPVLAVDDLDGNITINGAVAASVVYFEKSDSCDSIIIGAGISAAIPTSLAVEDIALDGTKIVSATALAINGTFTGNILSDSGVFTAKNLKGAVGTAYTISDKSGKLTLGGELAAGTLSVSDGQVYTDNNAVIKSITVDTGAELIVNGGGNQIETLTVNGLFTVPNAKQVTVATMTVNGTVDVAPVTETSGQGTLNVNTMYAGIAKKSYDSTAAAAPVINGPFTLVSTQNAVGTIVAINGTVFDDLAEESISACYSSDFVVEGKLWFTMYKLLANQQPRIDKAPIEDAYFEGWVLDLAGTVDPTSFPKIGGSTAGSHTTWYAYIDYAVYKIRIYSDAGIKSIAIDGVQMSHAGAVGSNFFETVNPIEKGVHTVTYTYEKDYTGSVNLYTMDNTILKDLKFTVSGTPEDEFGLTFTYQLYGSEQAVEPTPEPEPTPEVKEWTITTILLLILVILIAVMAVIVALRLNRN